MDGANANIRRLLRTILDETWETLRPEERARTSKALVAQRLINAVAAGERDHWWWTAKRYPLVYTKFIGIVAESYRKL